MKYHFSIIKLDKYPNLLCSAVLIISIIISESMVRRLLEIGVDLNAVNNVKQCALVVAIQLGFDKIAELLIKKGADVNIQGKFGLGWS